MQMTNKIPVTDRDITQKRIQAGNAPLSSCNYERAERAEPSHPILRSSLMSGRGSLLAHTLVMLGSLAIMLVIARLIANPDKSVGDVMASGSYHHLRQVSAKVGLLDI